MTTRTGESLLVQESRLQRAFEWLLTAAIAAASLFSRPYS